MGMRPSTEDWEQLVGSDLVPHLVPAGQPGGVRRPADVSWLPPGAHQALGTVIGRHGLEDLLIVPAAAWPCGGLRRRCLYAPLCVLGAGERAAGLWVQALPEPGIRAMVPLSEIAVIGQEADGPQRRLIITGRDSRLLVRCDAAGSMAAGALARRVRRRAAGDPGPVPAAPASLAVPRSWRHLPDPVALRLDGDEIAAAGRRSRRTGREILLAVTSREVIIACRPPGGRLRQGRAARELYIPRRHIEDAGVRSGTLLVRSAGRDLPITLGSARLAEAASSWLAQVIGGYDHTCADS
jgi:hypothetical protein